MKPKIVLGMILKNEAHIIEECLSRVLPYIDAWSIVDTGSSDDTPKIVERVLRDIPGKFYHRPWVNFGHNRGECFQLARDQGDYMLVFDADDEWVCSKDFQWPSQSLDDAFEMAIFMGDVKWKRPQVLKLTSPWMYRDAIHSAPMCPPGVPVSMTFIEDAHIVSRATGRRHIDDPVGKYVRDAQAFAALKDPTPRQVFYGAQSYRDAGRLGEAIKWYTRRIAMGGWYEEVWYSIYQIGRLHERLGDLGQATHFFLWAYDIDPARAEPLVACSRVLRQQKRHAAALLFSDTACGLTEPDRKLFLEPSCYTWRPLDEKAVALYWLKRFDEAISISEKLLTMVPAQEIGRIENNIRFARKNSIVALRPDK